MKRLILIAGLIGLLLTGSNSFAITWNGYGVHGGSISILSGQITAVTEDTEGNIPDFHWNKSNWTTRTGQKAFYVTSDLNGKKVGNISTFSWDIDDGYWGNAYFNIMVVDLGGKRAILAPSDNSATTTGWGSGYLYSVFEAEANWTGTAGVGWNAATWDEVKDLTITDGPFAEYPDTLDGDASYQDDPVYTIVNWAAWADRAAGADLDWEKGGVMITFGQSTGPGLYPETIINNLQISVLPVVNIVTGEGFETIQDAIDDASTVNGDIIEVQPADFTEPGSVHVTKSVTIQGKGKDVTTVHSNVNTSGAGHGVPSSAWFYTDPGTTVHFAEMTLDATGFDTKYSVVFNSGGSVTNVGFSEIKHSTDPYWGIAVQVLDGNVDVSGCTFTEIGRIGVHYRNGVIPEATISGTFDDNVYTGKGDGDWLDYALDISGGTTVTVSDSTISGNTGVALFDGSTSAGILVTTFFPFQQNVPNAVTIENNELTANTMGVVVGYDDNDVSVATINHNNIYGNTDYGVSSTVQLVDATCNWWGAADGPSGLGSGSGDAVTDYVTFSPWLDVPAPYESCIGGTLLGDKIGVREYLAALLPSGDKKTDDRIEKAIKHIDKSLYSDLWEDPSHLTKKGKKVFDEEKKAVKELERIVKEKKNDLLKTEAQEAIDKLVAVDQALAQTAIDDAIAGDGDQKEIDKALKQMDKAQKELDHMKKGTPDPKYDKAIDHYKKAWKHAQKAVA